MDILLKALAQAPLVFVIAYIWYTTRRDLMNEITRLQDRVVEKDQHLQEFASVFEKLALSLELIKDRLQR